MKEKKDKEHVTEKENLNAPLQIAYYLLAFKKYRFRQQKMLLLVPYAYPYSTQEFMKSKELSKALSLPISGSNLSHVTFVIFKLNLGIFNSTLKIESN